MQSITKYTVTQIEISFDKFIHEVSIMFDDLWWCGSYYSTENKTVSQYKNVYFCQTKILSYIKE